MKGDVVSIVEAAYELELGTREWLSLLLERSALHLDRGLGLVATIWRLDRGPVDSTIVTLGMDDAHRDAMMNASRTNPGRSHQQATSGLVLATATQQCALAEGEPLPADIRETYETHFYPVGIRDCQNLSFPDPSGVLVLIAAPMPDTRRPSRREITIWNQVAAHFAAGARLRLVASHAKADSLSEADAILSPSGALQHAGPAAQSRGAREALQRAAKAIDRARGKGRSDEDRALDAWQGLVAGRWSLVDRFDSDGRHYVVARRNDPDVLDPRALTRRERQVLAYTAMGHSLKLVAYSLGLSVSTIALHRARAMRKLGLRSHAEVVRLFTPRSR
jgi:DNA-binding CsgD family transcriptional regulator